LTAPGSEHGLARWLETDFICDRDGRRFVAAWRDSQCTRRTVALRQGSLQTGPHPHLRACCAAARAVLDPDLSWRVARSAALTGQTRIPVSHTKAASMTERYRCQIDVVIDKMIADSRSEEEIRTAICKQYEPYNTMPKFDEGFADYRARCWNKNYEGVAAQAYDRGANAAMWLSQAQQRMKPAAK
jgi:hypothetical protein